MHKINDRQPVGQGQAATAGSAARALYASAPGDLIMRTPGVDASPPSVPSGVSRQYTAHTHA